MGNVHIREGNARMYANSANSSSIIELSYPKITIVKMSATIASVPENDKENAVPLPQSVPPPPPSSSKRVQSVAPPPSSSSKRVQSVALPSSSSSKRVKTGVDHKTGVVHKHDVYYVYHHTHGNGLHDKGEINVEILSEFKHCVVSRVATNLPLTYEFGLTLDNDRNSACRVRGSSKTGMERRFWMRLLISVSDLGIVSGFHIDL
jgi:hypothetical protein